MLGENPAQETLPPTTQNKLPPREHPFRGPGLDGRWYTGYGIDPKFDVYYIHMDQNDNMVEELTRVAEQRALELDEPLIDTLAAAGAIAHGMRVNTPNAQCGGCGTSVRPMIACESICEMLFCHWSSSKSLEGQLSHERACIDMTYEEIVEKLTRDSRDGVPKFHCPTCFKTIHPTIPYNIVEMTRPAMGVLKKTSRAPLLIIGLTDQAFSVTSNARLVREMFESIYANHPEFFVYVQIWLNESELTDKSLMTDKNDAAIQFLEKHMNARILVLLETHSNPKSGSLMIHRPCAMGINEAEDLIEFELPMLLRRCFDERLHSLILNPRSGLEFDEYTPDPLRGLIICAHGPYFQSPARFSDAKELIDERRLDFILGFGKSSLLPLECSDGVLSFAIEVLCKEMSVWSARQACFASESRMIGLLPVLIEAVPLTRELTDSLQQKHGTWAQRWTSNRHPRLKDIPKGAKYKTQSSVLELIPAFGSNYGFPLPPCGYCQRTQFVKTQNFDMKKAKTKLYCAACNSKAIYDSPNPGVHYLEAGKSGRMVIYPWPKALAKWEPTIVWQPKDVMLAEPPRQEQEAQTHGWVSEELPSSDIDDSFFQVKPFKVIAQAPVRTQPSGSNQTTSDRGEKRKLSQSGAGPDLEKTAIGTVSKRKRSRPARR